MSPYLHVSSFPHGKRFHLNLKDYLYFPSISTTEDKIRVSNQIPVKHLRMSVLQK